MVWVPPQSGKRGRQQHFSDAAIQACLTLKVLFGRPLRQTTGFVQSLLQLIGLDWAVKAEGEGEWNTRKHGGSKRRIWRKIHIGIDEETLGSGPIN